MKTSRFSESQIAAIPGQAASGVPVPAPCREHGISSTTFCKRRSKCGRMDASKLRRMKEMEAENSRLKRMYADTGIRNELLKEALGKSSEAGSTETFPRFMKQEIIAD